MDLLKLYTDPLNDQNLCNSVTKSFLLMLPDTISWNFLGWSFIRISKGRQWVFLFYSPIPLFGFFSGIAQISPFCLNFPKVKVTNLRIIEIFFKKVCPWSPASHLVWIFTGMGNSRKKTRGLRIWWCMGNFQV